MNIDEKIAEYKADIEKCERVCEVTAIGSIREAATKKAKDCKQMVEWLEDYKRLKAEQKHKADILDKIRKEIVEKEIALKCTEVSNIASKIAYTEALKIIDKYKAESEAEDADSD